MKNLLIFGVAIIWLCGVPAWADSIDVEFGPPTVFPSTFSSAPAPYVRFGNTLVPGASPLPTINVDNFNGLSFPSNVSTGGYAASSSTFSSAPVNSFSSTPLFSTFSSAPIYGTLNGAAYGQGRSNWSGTTVRHQTVTRGRWTGSRGGRR